MDSSVGLEELLSALGGADTPRPKAPTRPGRERKERTAGASRSSGAGDGRATRAGPADTVEPSGPTPEPGPGEDPSVDVRSAWSEALEAARGTAPGGRLIGLRGATVSGYADGELQLEIPAGLAGDLREYLADARRSAALRKELGTRLGIDPASLGFRVGKGGSSQRITAESAKDLKLKRLVDADPRLREAVETLDLKLTEE